MKLPRRQFLTWALFESPQRDGRRQNQPHRRRGLVAADATAVKVGHENDFDVLRSLAPPGAARVKFHPRSRAPRSRAAAGRCVSARRSASQKAVSIPTSCSRVHPPARASWLSSPSSRSLLWPRRRSGTCFVMVTPSSTARAALGPSALGAVRLFPRETTISKVFADRSLAGRSALRRSVPSSIAACQDSKFYPQRRGCESGVSCLYL
jgi:hypothetical protein